MAFTSTYRSPYVGAISSRLGEMRCMRFAVTLEGLQKPALGLGFGGDAAGVGVAAKVNFRVRGRWFFRSRTFILHGNARNSLCICSGEMHSCWIWMVTGEAARGSSPSLYGMAGGPWSCASDPSLSRHCAAGDRHFHVFTIHRRCYFATSIHSLVRRRLFQFLSRTVSFPVYGRVLIGPSRDTPY